MVSEMKLVDNVINIFKMVLNAIAAVALLVGGIGIMNIMLVSVRERTQEIGIRKALGARNFQILGQFLAESLFYTLIGSTIGIVMGLAMSKLIAQVIGIEPVFTITSILIATCFSML